MPLVKAQEKGGRFEEVRGNEQVFGILYIVGENVRKAVKRAQ